MTTPCDNAAGTCFLKVAHAVCSLHKEASSPPQHPPPYTHQHPPPRPPPVWAPSAAGGPPCRSRRTRRCGAGLWPAGRGWRTPRCGAAGGAASHGHQPGPPPAEPGGSGCRLCVKRANETRVCLWAAFCVCVRAREPTSACVLESIRRGDTACMLRVTVPGYCPSPAVLHAWLCTTHTPQT